MSAWDELAKSLPARHGATGRDSDGRPRRPILDDACIRFLSIHSAFEDQRKPGSMAREHIDGCKACQQYFRWQEWNRKREEEFYASPEVVGLVEEYARRFRLPFWQRRRVQLTGGLLLLLLAVTLVLFLATRSRARGAPPVLAIGVTASPGSPTPNIDRDRALREQELDRTFQEGGAPAIAKILSKGSETEVLIAMQWIRSRQHTSLIPSLVGALSDPRNSVRFKATLCLGNMPPIPIKPFQATLNAAAAAETDQVIAVAMQRLATKVAQAR